MSELDDAIAHLDRAVARLEAAPRLVRLESGELEEGHAEAVAEAARLAEVHAAEGERVRLLTGQIVTRVEAALGKIGRALGEDG